MFETFSELFMLKCKKRICRFEWHCTRHLWLFHFIFLHFCPLCISILNIHYLLSVTRKTWTTLHSALQMSHWKLHFSPKYFTLTSHHIIWVFFFSFKLIMYVGINKMKYLFIAWRVIFQNSDNVPRRRKLNEMVDTWRECVNLCIPWMG